MKAPSCIKVLYVGKTVTLMRNLSHQQRYNRFLNKLAIYALGLLFVTAGICNVATDLQYRGDVYLLAGTLVAVMNVFIACKSFDTSAALDEGLRKKDGDYFTNALKTFVGCLVIVAFFAITGTFLALVAAGSIAQPHALPTLPFTLFFIPPFVALFALQTVAAFSILRKAYQSL